MREWEKIDLIMISEKLKRGEVLELDNIKVGTLGKKSPYYTCHFHKTY